MVGNIGHVFTNLSGISCVVICDDAYPQRVAFTLINQILDDTLSQFSLENLLSASELEMPYLETYLKKYQDPAEADPLMRVQKEVDDCTNVLHRTLESLLERGEKLDDLMAKSDQLGAQSRAFYKVAKKSNSCCVVQ
jgi:synaptobrevin family protein YKT6